MRFFETHRALLDQAVAATRTRGYWSAYPEIASGKIYGESAKADAEAAFQAMLGKPFDLDQPGSKRAGQEMSPYGFSLGITYPSADPDTLTKASAAAGRDGDRLRWTSAPARAWKSFTASTARAFSWPTP